MTITLSGTNGITMPTGGTENAGIVAWANFNGSATSGSATLRASFNVTSITIGGTGIYTINFTNALPDANYAILGSGSNTTGDGTCIVQSTTTNTTTSCTVNCKVYGGSIVNGTYNYFAVIR